MPLVDGGPVAQLDQVGLGQPVGLAPTRRARSWRPSAGTTTLSSGVPATARANHGAATTSTKVSASSLRQTNEPPQRVRARREAADQQPLRGSVTPSAAAQSGDGQQAARRAAQRRRKPRGLRRRSSSSASTIRPANGEPGSRTLPAGSEHASTSAAGHLGPGRRDSYVRPVVARLSGTRSSAGGLPSHDTPACAVLRRGAADSTATSDAFRHLAARGGHARSCRRSSLPDLHPLDAQPATAELAAPIRVSSARNDWSLTWVSDGISSTVQASTSFPTSGAQRARSQIGVRLEA